MPRATDRQWVMQYGNLPWWRCSVGPVLEGHKLPTGGPRIGRASKEGRPARLLRRFDLSRAYGNLHWSQDEAVALIRSIVAEHPGWTVDQVKRELLRRRGVLRAETSRRVFPPSTVAAGDTPEVSKMAQQPAIPVLSRDMTPWERKVDFAAIETGTARLIAQGVDRVRRLLTEARDKLVALVTGRVNAGTLSARFVLDLELRGLGQLIPVLREVLGGAFRLGQREAQKEVRRPNVDAEEMRAYQVKLHPEGLPPEKALEFFERKAALLGTDIRQPLLGDIKNILFDGIKQGTGLRELQDRLTDAFLPFLGDPDQAVDDALLTPFRLETLVRTNITEALNEGRKAQVQQAVDDGFVIGFQFSAILDTRTTEVCKFLDKKVFRPDSPELDRLTPPRCWQCRSILVPVTRPEGPVQFITPAQVAKGIELSCKGFSAHGDTREYELHTDPESSLQVVGAEGRTGNRMSAASGTDDGCGHE